MEGLMTELSDLSRRNDELMTAKDADLAVIRDMDSQLKEYKRKYEQAKTELRSIKGTYIVILPPPSLTSCRRFSYLPAVLAAPKVGRSASCFTRRWYSRHPYHRFRLRRRQSPHCWPLTCSNPGPQSNEVSRERCFHHNRGRESLRTQAKARPRRSRYRRASGIT